MKADEYGLYKYRQGDVERPGPYFGIQIQHMILAGTIYADAIIEPIFGDGKLPVVSFLKDFGTQAPSVQDVAVIGLPKEPITTAIKDIEMPMGSMVTFMVRWTIATIPAALLICALAGIGVMVGSALAAVLSH